MTLHLAVAASEGTVEIAGPVEEHDGEAVALLDAWAAWQTGLGLEVEIVDLDLSVPGSALDFARTRLRGWREDLAEVRRIEQEEDGRG